MQFRRHLPKVGAGLSGLSLTLPALAQYAPPAAFTDAVTDATEAVGTLAGALIGVAAAAVVVMIALKYVKKIRSAA